MYLASFLNQDHYRLYNVPLAKKLGSIHGAILLCELISQRDFFHSQKTLTNHEKYGDGWFYYTIDKVEERTCLSRKNQDTEIKELERLGLIEVKSFGLPAKRHFRINDQKIIDLLNYSNKHSSLTETDKVQCLNHTKYDDRGGQTALYIEEPKKEPKKERVPPPSKIFFREFVCLTQDEYDKLLTLHKQPLLDQMLDKLNSYKATSGKVYKSDYHTMINGGWVFKEFKEPKQQLQGAKTNSLRTAHDQNVNLSQDLAEKKRKEFLEKAKKHSLGG